jgi:hypothetical protein
MIYERKDRKVRAEILADNGKELLVKAFWPASKQDARKFFCVDGVARNVLTLKKADFDHRYHAL